MAIPLYDVSVRSFVQVLGAVDGFLERGRAHFAEKGGDLEALVETRLHSDMLPFRFQIISVAHHSRGAMEAAAAGVFRPPSMAEPLDYAALQRLVQDARAGLEGLKPEDVEALEGRDLVFELGSRKLPFKVEGFLMSFSLPNLHFHATTAYDILRQAGVPLGKRDYMGQMRLSGPPS